MKAYKTEIKLTKEQETIVNKTIGTCRFVYNAYIHYNKEVYEKEKKFVSAYDFSKYLNNVFLPNNIEYSWIKEVSSKAIKQSIVNAERAFKNFFNKKGKFPRFKKKKDNNVKFYFVKNSKEQIIKCERHRIKIPTLGYTRIKEKGYLPIKQIIKSGTVSKEAGRFYVSILTDSKQVIKTNNSKEGLGIDLGINKFIVTSNNSSYENINKTKKVKRLNKKLKREQRSLSRKYEVSKRTKERSKNFEKNILRVQKIHKTLNNVRRDYINKVVDDLTKAKLNSITVESLNIKGMMKNRHLARAIAEMNFFYFKQKLLYKCYINNIELREVSRFFPSSKLCSSCGNIKKDLKLKDRIYKCEHCNLEICRDENASFNLKNAKEFVILNNKLPTTVPMACRELTTVEC